MISPSRISYPVIALVSALSVACTSPRQAIDMAKSPLNDYMKEYYFTPFNPPREGDGAGTIITFDSNKVESIVFPPEKCLRRESIPVGDSPVALLATEYTLTSNNQLELSLPQLTKYQIDISGAIGKNGVKTVSIKFLQPMTQRITKGEAKYYTRALNKKSSCFEEIMRNDNLVIHTVLGARGVEYSFNGESNQKIKLSIEILKSIKLGPDLQDQYKGKASIDFKTDPSKKEELLLLGYRAWRASDVPNALEAGVEFVDLSPSDISSLKNR